MVFVFVFLKQKLLFGELNSTITVFPSPIFDEPYWSFIFKTSVKTNASNINYKQHKQKRKKKSVKKKYMINHSSLTQFNTINCKNNVHSRWFNIHNWFFNFKLKNRQHNMPTKQFFLEKIVIKKNTQKTVFINIHSQTIAKTNINWYIKCEKTYVSSPFCGKFFQIAFHFFKFI